MTTVEGYYQAYLDGRGSVPNPFPRLDSDVSGTEGLLGLWDSVDDAEVVIGTGWTAGHWQRRTSRGRSAQCSD